MEKEGFTLSASSSPSSFSPSSSIAARLEALPLGRFHKRFVALVALGGWFDLYDLFMMSYIGAALQQSGFLSLNQFSLLIASGFAGMFVGTVFFGVRSDRMGRRSAFVTMLLIYSAFSLIGAFAPSANWLIAMRFLAGIGIGAEIVVIDTYVTEMAPRKARGRFVAVTQVVGFTAVPAVALLSRFLVPTHFLWSGWRWIMIIGSCGALLAWYFRRNLPESPRWLESHGFIAEANEVVARLESDAGVAISYASAEESKGKVFRESRRPSLVANFLSLWGKQFRKITIMLVIFQALQTLGFYGFANWVPTFLIKRGFPLVHSLTYAMLIATVAPLGPLAAAITSDHLERKWTIVVMALLIAACGLGFAFGSAPAVIILSGACVTFLNNWFSAVFHAYQTELFPTRMRATGVGFTYSWSRLTAALSAFLIAVVLNYGVPAVFVMLTFAMIGVALVIAVLGPQTNRLTLEELSA